MGVVEQAIEQRGDGGGIAEQLAQRRCPLVAAHHDLEEILRRRVWEFPHSEIVDDEQWHGGDRRDVVLACAGELSVGQIFEQDMRFTVEHVVALLDDGKADRLRQVALARARRPEEEGIGVLGHPARGSSRRFQRWSVAGSTRRLCHGHTASSTTGIAP